MSPAAGEISAGGAAAREALVHEACSVIREETGYYFMPPQLGRRIVEGLAERGYLQRPATAPAECDEFEEPRLPGWVHAGAPALGAAYDGSDEP